MKKTTILFAATIVMAQGLFAEYPRDAAERFRLKYGINHPVVEQEARAAREAKLKRAQAQSESKKSQEADSEITAKPDPSDSENRSSPDR
jgi:hypothetical protein